MTEYVYPTVRQKKFQVRLGYGCSLMFAFVGTVSLLANIGEHPLGVAICMVPLAAIAAWVARAVQTDRSF